MRRCALAPLFVLGALLTSAGCWPSAPPPCPVEQATVALADESIGFSGQSVVDAIGSEPIRKKLTWHGDDGYAADPVDVALTIEFTSPEMMVHVEQEVESRGLRVACLHRGHWLELPVRITLSSTDGAFDPVVFEGRAEARSPGEVSISIERRGVPLRPGDPKIMAHAREETLSTTLYLRRQDGETTGRVSLYGKRDDGPDSFNRGAQLSD